ncbi:response regulator transcription factor [Thermoflavimicrobium dichotomicum]|uniref:DNA-binding response regulator, OmpR family, contains REC and winged-helix (WHTH) domain n=1 Tax=Thermoflavimicrobium dichotomicum TaxID=46223 RepID=A0A1I3LV81_9BACL|nr:response regulator transcription factor [Thermoflavimicrobium dichotomicum]SFI88583.1 DNA-binding response regulator, OmpR family, contains REC and winged-helix (wHTH) domain [Thermoflavimicrobium dichotomicum]
MNYRIYIVEDEEKIAQSIRSYLQQYGYDVFVVQEFTKVIEEFTSIKPHLVILDVNLPYQDGFHLCRQIRQLSSVPILFLSARASEMEQVMGMESGGDDYITKPFHLEVLHAKCKAILRRTYGEYAREEGSIEPIIRVGELTLHIGKMEMDYGGQVQSLTKNEVKLLRLLMERAGKVVTREDCLEALWDDIDFVDDNTLTVNVTRVRKKLGKWNLDHLIQTKRGVGYIFDINGLEETR